MKQKIKISLLAIFLTAGIFAFSPNSKAANVDSVTATPGVIADDGSYFIALSTTTAGASIYYTVDGSTPTTGSMPYSSPVYIAQNTTIKAIATNAGMTDSDIFSQLFNVYVATPTRDIDPLIVYTTAQMVTLNSATVGADIFYTLDGSDPTTFSTHYVDPIPLSNTTTIKAIAVKTGMSNSDILNAAYTINIPVVDSITATPDAITDAPYYIALSTNTAGAIIYYTVNGTTPTVGSTQYSSPIYIAHNTIIKAVAVKLGMIDSNVFSQLFNVYVATPESSVPAGTYASAQVVVLTSKTAGADIYYTLNGDTPTNSSAKYVNPIPLSSSQTIRAIGIKAGLANSSVMSEDYLIDIPKVDAPTFSINGDPNIPPYTVTLTSTTAGANIYYTTNGSDPTTSSTQYVAPINIPINTTIKAIAAKAGMSDSDIFSQLFNVFTVSPVATPVAGTYTSAQSVTLSTITSGASIYYTLNGSIPTTSSTLYTAPFSIGSSQTINAISVKAGFVNGNVFTAAYVINIPVPEKKKVEEVTPPRTVSNSKKTAHNGDTIYQRGKKFSKNTIVKLYFAKPDGTYYPPMSVKTTKAGAFTVKYVVNKPKGTYKWYALDTKSGKKSKTVKYQVK